jgi:hypothetical protein
MIERARLEPEGSRSGDSFIKFFVAETRPFRDREEPRPRMSKEINVAR